MRLYHYTCRCAARRITRYGMLQPNPFRLLGVPLLWLTDQEEPDAEALGLTRSYHKCDRTEVRYVVEIPVDHVEPWLQSATRAAFAQTAPVFIHEFEEGREPERWWIAMRVVPGTRDRDYDRRISMRRPEDRRV